jgi:transcriptional regulator with XRE-family HTH domain
MLTPENIKTARQRKGMTQIKVVQESGYSFTLNSYRNWELGATKPNKENEDKLREVLGLEVSQ